MASELEEMPGVDELVEFVRRADALAWPDGLVADGEDLPGFMRTAVAEGDFRFVDLFGGARTDIGLEVVFWRGIQIWGATYRGGLSDPEVCVEEAYGLLARALAVRPADVLPIRGPSLYEEPPHWEYRHRLDGDFGAFTSLERIYLDGRQVYERITLGGWSGDSAPYGPSIALPDLP